MSRSITFRRKGRPPAVGTATSAAQPPSKRRRLGEKLTLAEQEERSRRQAQTLIDALASASAPEDFVGRLEDLAPKTAKLIRASTRQYWCALGLVYKAQRAWRRRPEPDQQRILSMLRSSRAKGASDGFAAFAHQLIDYGSSDGSARVRASRDVACLRRAAYTHTAPDQFEAFVKREGGLDACAKYWREQRKTNKHRVRLKPADASTPSLKPATNESPATRPDQHLIAYIHPDCATDFQASGDYVAIIRYEGGERTVVLVKALKGSSKRTRPATWQRAFEAAVRTLEMETQIKTVK